MARSQASFDCDDGDDLQLASIPWPGERTWRVVTFGRTRMNLEELEASLPNGLHDAQLCRFEVDYINRTASIVVSIWIGDLDGTTREAREVYRQARIDLQGLAFAAVDPPEKTSGDGSLRIDSGTGVAPTSDLILPSHLPKNCFVHWIFVTQWNAFIHVAAETATICWMD
jgi:hypothetical protein